MADDTSETQEQWEARVCVSRDAGWSAPTCFSCRFFTREFGRIVREDDGFCRRHAPSPRIAVFVRAENDQGEPHEEWSGHVTQEWPLVRAADWCGEHEPFRTYGATHEAD